MAYEYKFTIGGAQYTEADVKMDNCRICRTAFERFGIGNVSSARLELEVWPKGTIPEAAEIQVYGRHTDSTSDTWQPLGVFYVDERTDNGGTMLLTCFDAMMKAELPFRTYGAAAWPMPMDKVVRLIAQTIGVDVDPQTAISGYSMSYPDKYTCWDVLAHIAAAHGGNFVITRQNRLLLVPLTMTGLPRLVGKNALSFEIYTAAKPVSRIVLNAEDDVFFTAGDNTGLTLTADCPSATKQMAEAVLADLQGYVYQGFFCGGAKISPFADLCQTVTITNTAGLVFTGRIQEIEFTFSKNGFMDISAPAISEETHEYTDKFRNRGTSEETERVKDELYTQIEEGAMKLYGYVSPEAYTVGVGTGASQDVTVAEIDFKAGRGVLTAFYCEIKHTTETLEETSVNDGTITVYDAVLTFKYYLNDVLLDYQPVETEQDGARLLHFLSFPKTDMSAWMVLTKQREN